AAADPARSHAERGGEAGRRDRGRRWRGGGIELDPLAAPVGREQTALGVEPGMPVRREATLFPQHVRAREGRVTAQGHLDRRGEPAEPVSLVLDRKSTRLNSSHEWISYAVFC